MKIESTSSGADETALRRLKWCLAGLHSSINDDFNCLHDLDLDWTSSDSGSLWAALTSVPTEALASFWCKPPDANYTMQSGKAISARRWHGIGTCLHDLNLIADPLLLWMITFLLLLLLSTLTQRLYPLKLKSLVYDLRSPGKLVKLRLHPLKSWSIYMISDRQVNCVPVFVTWVIGSH